MSYVFSACVLLSQTVTLKIEEELKHTVCPTRKSYSCSFKFKFTFGSTIWHLLHFQVLTALLDSKKKIMPVLKFLFYWVKKKVTSSDLDYEMKCNR
jgi:hypothetical protein